MRNHMAAAAFTCLLAICGTVGAKTVALWPLDSARCAIDPRNDLTVNKASFEAQTIGWNLPPNADSNVTDSARYLFDPVSRSCLRSGKYAPSAGTAGNCYTAYISVSVCKSYSFTVKSFNDPVCKL